MPSEFQSQNKLHAANTKSALNDGFLNGVGQDKRFEQNPIVFDALEEVFLKYGELFINEFRTGLIDADANASGETESSFRFEYTKAGGGVYGVKIFMSDTAKFTDEGVQGVDSGKNINVTSPYKFKFKTPSLKHIAALEKWITEKNVTAIITVPKGIATKETTPKDLATAMGFKIKERGIRATYFKKKAVEKLAEKFKAEIAIAAGNDMKINILF